MNYETEQDFRKAVEKKIGCVLSDDDWLLYAPDWSPPYDNHDLRDVVSQIPHAKPAKPGKPDYLKAAYVRADFIPPSVQDIVTKIRQELFGSIEPPFKDFDAMREWIIEEAKSQPPGEGHAPRYGYRMEKGISVEELNELMKKKPGVYGVEFPLLDFPSEDIGWISHVLVSDGTKIRQLWLTVCSVAQRLDCQEAQATAYILTGIKPLIQPITVEPHSNFNFDGPHRGKIVITIREPVSTDDMLSKYKAARERLWGHKYDHKLPTDKDEALVRFILPRLNPDKPDWDGLRVQWNRQYPDWSFDSWRYLKITYERAYEKIYPPINFGPVTIKD